MLRGKGSRAVVAAFLAAALAAFAGCRCCDCNTERDGDQGTETGAGAAGADSPYHKPGFVTRIEEGRLWVLRSGQEMSEKHVTFVGAGPAGLTIKALDRATAAEYLAAEPGFQVSMDEDDRLWIYRDGEPLVRPEKHVTRVGAGPLGTTVKARESETLDAWTAARR